MGAFIRDPRATTTELRKGAVKPEIERDPGNSQNVSGRKDGGRTEMGKTRRKEGERNHRGSMENKTEPVTGKT